MSEKKKQVVHEIHRPARKNFPRRRVIVRGIDDLWQADLADMISYAKRNDGHKYILVVINCFSKYVWCEPVKSKSADEIANAMSKILSENRPPKNLQTDMGKEFYNAKFKKLMTEFKITHYSTYSVKKASIVERVIRTLKEKIWKNFALRGEYRWLDALPSVVHDYNNSVHRTIKMKPSEVDATNEREIFRRAFDYGREKKSKSRPKFKIGDYVRISKQKGVFDKGYLANWSTELFIVARVQATEPVTYLLNDLNGSPVKGGFYEYELQKTKNHDVYLVEKVIKRDGNRLYVKWLGFPSSQNSWVNADDVV